MSGDYFEQEAKNKNFWSRFWMGVAIVLIIGFLVYCVLYGIDVIKVHPAITILICSLWGVGIGISLNTSSDLFKESKELYKRAGKK